MKLTVLNENTVSGGEFICEHGLSILLETEKHKILFDMGQSDVFAKNAETMGVDLSNVDVAVLSHGHYDHGGGITKFFSLNKKSKIYLNENSFGDYHNGTSKYIGLNKELKIDDRFVFVSDELRIDDELSLYSCNNLSRLFKTDHYGLTKKVNDIFLPDDFMHEQYLLVEEKGKRILISGCSHKGVLNIQNWFKPDVFIGGFHLSKLNPEKTEDASALQEIALKLKQYNTKYYTAHCTGVEQYGFLKKELKSQLDYLSTGNVFEIKN